MEKNKKFWFFGSKLNTALLLVLIILMIIAIRIMLQNREIYFPSLVNTPSEEMNTGPTADTTPTATPEILGNKADLVSFSILPGSNVHGILSYRGSIKGGYFSEGNIVINILDANKNVIKNSNAKSTSDWMTTDPVSFEGNIDFTGLTKGPAYFEIHNDNASGLPQNDKSVLIPIVIQ